MKKSEITKKVSEFVKNKLEIEVTGHDWWHAYRVWKLAKKIAKKEKDVDLLVVELGALLHDIADHKFHNGNITGKILANNLLDSLNVDKKVINKVEYIIENISFSNGGKVNSIEAKIVQDADRLDALGAIGIARTFAYGGFAKKQIYNPSIKPKKYKTVEEYKDSKSTSINHFFEKLLLLKDLMNTKTGKIIARKRHKFLEDYLKEFFEEWEDGE